MEELDNIQNIKIYLNPVNKESRTRTLKYKLIPFVLILTFVIFQSKLFPFQEKQNIEARNLAETEMIKMKQLSFIAKYRSAYSLNPLNFDDEFNLLNPKFIGNYKIIKMTIDGVKMDNPINKVYVRFPKESIISLN